MRRVLGWMVVLGSGMVASCGGTSTSTNPVETCAPGSEGCACYGNGSCNAGLDCRSNLCVNLGAPNEAGATRDALPPPLRPEAAVDAPVAPDQVADARVRLLGGTCPPATVGVKTLSHFADGFAVFEDGAYMDEFLCTATDCKGTVPPGGTISPALTLSASGSELPTAIIPGCTTRALNVQITNILSEDVTVGAIWDPGAEMDLSAYQGIALTVKGNAPGVSFELDTPCALDAAASCGHFYYTTFDTQAQWTEVRIPWSEFRENGQRGVALAPMDTTRINGVWFWLPRQDCDIWIGAIGVY
jgi:hypothetical protein